MKNKTYQLCVILCLFSKIMSAQSIERQVLSSNGHTLENNDLIIQQTIGQPLTKTLNIPNTVLTQGFQQVEIKVVKTQDLRPEVEISFFPNPTTDFINYKIDKGNFENTNITLFGADAQLLLSTPLQANGGNIDISTLADGVYILTINSRNIILKSYQIIKLSK